MNQKGEVHKKELKAAFRKAKILVWITIGYLVFDATLLYLVMQNSQAMKASWFEDLLFFIPSISFLVASSIVKKPANYHYRFGYDRAYSVGFLAAAIALLSIGSFLLIESIIKLVNGEVITIGNIVLFGENIWFGWLMIAAVGYSIIPVYILGKKKLKIAREINSQILYTDAKGQKADWLTSVATIIGIIGIGFGLWWADAVAAIIIAVDILSDGISAMRTSVAEIMERTPLNAALKEDPIIQQVEDLVQQEEWIGNSLVRLKRAGLKIKGEILIIPKEKGDLQDQLSRLSAKVEGISWELEDILISPVKELPPIYKQKIF